MRKLTSFPKLQPDDSRKLLELADLCTDTVAHMEELPHLSTLNAPHGLYPIVEKLPTFIINDWRKKVSSYKQRYGIFPPFSYFAEFIKGLAISLNDPDVPNPGNTSPLAEKTRSNQPSRITARVHATTTSSEEKHCPIMKFQDMN